MTIAKPLGKDWIESFLNFTDGIASPEIFRKWTAISTVAGALQRRVWIQTAQSFIYPNLYVLLVAPPGIGKSQAISRASDFWNRTEGLHVAPDSVTRASLVDNLDEANVKVVSPDKTTLLSFNALTVAAGEFGVLVPAHDMDFLSVLNHIFDNPRSHKEHRRSNKGKQIEIVNPTLNVLAGTQPAYLAELLPEYAWGQGFTSRLIMIYSAQEIEVDLFTAPAPNHKLEQRLQLGLKDVTEKLFGQMAFSDEAIVAINDWRKRKLEPTPTHSRLQNYNPRRILHILKLCMVSAASRLSMDITLDDFQRARDWLLEAEVLMPDIFRDMAGKSDKLVLDDLHSAMWQMYARTKKPIHEARIYEFLRGKVPSEKLFRLVEVAEKSGLIRREAGKNDWFTPAPVDGIQGVE